MALPEQWCPTIALLSMAGWKSSLPILGPLLAGGLLWWLLAPSSPQVAGGSDPSGTSGSVREDGWSAVSFADLKPGGTIPGWEFAAGGFAIVELEGRTVLALNPEPMGEGQLRFSQMFTGRGGLRARMKGEKARRSAPRFGVSFHNEAQYQLRATPSSGVLELTRREDVLASTEWKADPNSWLWLELRVEGPVFEGRAWKEGEPRPEKPQVQWTAPAPPGLLRAVVQGAPYANRPIYYDRIEVLR